MAEIVKMKKVYVPVLKESKTLKWKDMWKESKLYISPHRQVLRDNSFSSVGVLEIEKCFKKKDTCSFTYNPFGGTDDKVYWTNIINGIDKKFIPGKHVLVLFNDKPYFARKSTFTTDYVEDVDNCTEKTREFLNKFKGRATEKGNIEECLKIFEMAGTSLENIKIYNRVPSCFIGLKLDGTYSVQHRHMNYDPYSECQIDVETQIGNAGNYIVQWIDNEMDLKLNSLHVFDELPSYAEEIGDIEMLKQVRGLSQKVLERGKQFFDKRESLRR